MNLNKDSLIMIKKKGSTKFSLFIQFQKMNYGFNEKNNLCKICSIIQTIATVKLKKNGE